jgi:hypothetical protein
MIEMEKISRVQSDVVKKSTLFLKGAFAMP